MFFISMQIQPICTTQGFSEISGRIPVESAGGVYMSVHGIDLNLRAALCACTCYAE